MADQFWECVDLGRLERFGLGNQVVVARRSSHCDQVNADRCRSRAVVGCGELVDDGRHANSRVLRGLGVLDRFGRDYIFNGDGHDCALSNQMFVVCGINRLDFCTPVLITCKLDVIDASCPCTPKSSTFEPRVNVASENKVMPLTNTLR